MTTINISLPKELRDHVETRARLEHYSTSEYVRNLIREDMRRTHENMLDDYLLLCMREIESGHVGKFDVDQIIAQEKRKLRRRPRKQR